MGERAKEEFRRKGTESCPKRAEGASATFCRQSLYGDFLSHGKKKTDNRECKKNETGHSSLSPVSLQ